MHIQTEGMLERVQVAVQHPLNSKFAPVIYFCFEALLKRYETQIGLVARRANEWKKERGPVPGRNGASRAMGSSPL
jgi:hypothetical protein